MFKRMCCLRFIPRRLHSLDPLMFTLMPTHMYIFLSTTLLSRLVRDFVSTRVCPDLCVILSRLVFVPTCV